MSQADVKRAKTTKKILAEDLFQEIDDEAAALPPATEEALAEAFELIGNEFARRETLTRRAGDDATADRLMAGLWTLHFARGALDEDVLLNDFLRYAEHLREELADLPPSDPDDDDAWIQK